MEPTSLIVPILNAARGWHQRRRRVRLTVHRALLQQPYSQDCYFVNATNLGDRAVELTHVWFATDVPVYQHNDLRPLPKRLEPDESWETWFPVAAIPVGEGEAFRLARARLSNDKVVKSRKRENVPLYGMVPGA